MLKVDTYNGFEVEGASYIEVNGLSIKGLLRLIRNDLTGPNR